MTRNPQGMMTFDKFNLHPQILKALSEAGYTEPTEVQERTIPQIASGVDIRASAQTGTGKTAAFVLPALNRIVTSPTKPRKAPRVLILAPTRELALQISQQVEKYSKYLQRTKTVCVTGGVSYHIQRRKLSRPYDVLIATPGRLIDYLEQGQIDLSYVEMLILDEADRMLDMGFVEPVEQIVEATNPSRQTLLFSATLDKSIIKLSERLMNNPQEIAVHAKRAKHENITQGLHYVDGIEHKNRILDHILEGDNMEFAIVFTSTKRHADQLVRELRDKDFEAEALHGDMSQRQRTRTITQLKNGKFRILVATDVAARGIDVQSITHVINFDLPRNIEDYVHRIGRTGRAGAKGTALSFASRRDGILVKKIQEFTGQKIDVVEIKGLEPRMQKESSYSKKPRPNFNSRSRPQAKKHSNNFKHKSKKKPIRKK